MASDMLQKILDAENKCNSEIEKAQTEADRILNSAKEECDKITADILAKAESEAKAYLKSAQIEADKSKTEAEIECEKTINTLKENAMPKFNEAVDCVIKTIIST